MASLSDLGSHNPSQGLRLSFREVTRHGDNAGGERDQADNDQEAGATEALPRAEG